MILTVDSLNLILIYNLHADKNLETFNDVLSKVCSFATSVAATAPPPILLSAPSPIYAVNTAICS